MYTPTVDIVVPVWNNPFDTRACLAAILEHSPNARLIIVANGSSRETELMLEEFSEPLGERALFLLSEKNLGLIPAINRGLTRSDSDVTIILRPNVLVNHGWLDALLEAKKGEAAGIITPLFHGDGSPAITPPVKGCSLQETFSISFSTLLLSGEMRMIIGSFDENLDGGTCCLSDYMARAEKSGYRVYCTSHANLLCKADNFFGSLERRQIIAAQSMEKISKRWGDRKNWCLYSGKDTENDELNRIVDVLLKEARRGNRALILLHGKQYNEAIKRGWHGLHTGLILQKLSFFSWESDVIGKFNQLCTIEPQTVPIRGSRTLPFPGLTDAPYWEEVIT